VSDARAGRQTLGDERLWCRLALKRMIMRVRRWVMRAHPGRTLSVLVIAAVALAVALGLVLAVEPGAQPAILLVGLVATLVLYGVGYVVQRRRHW
jgi:hypothetical protein